jgi:hypothetical protein
VGQVQTQCVTKKSKYCGLCAQLPVKTSIVTRCEDVIRLAAVGAAYLDETGVARNSTTETYVALRLEIESWRWAGVPFYLRTGKRLPVRASEISVTFRSAPLMLFQDSIMSLDRSQRVGNPHPT